ncbi:hypothetical protein AGR7C_Lc20020 [Agrobacterium deltaense Zutra 3/1]|uniref:Uncharacterized protein n=1 Tax=Agrobacterium deltaense Zutra 3/1 TaxID=1183427 RepID=A0A1S7RJR2_9HYPH|nr:hypothetical protein AGR7C_Lc20020 [Agrobacterium deltaense Zutra 3/1]
MLSSESFGQALTVLKISWIEPHEPLHVTRNGRTADLSLTGMKVKTLPTTFGCGLSLALTGR